MVLHGLQSLLGRLYEIWLKTGSPRARGLLSQLGVQPVRAAGARREH